MPSLLNVILLCLEMQCYLLVTAVVVNVGGKR
jgi:hypothetical protein